MASASSLPCEEQLLCSICLCVFTEPVTTPCGHNYCKACIIGYWASSGLTQCPLCKKRFRRRPQLQVNTEFRDMVEHFNNMRVRSDDETLAKPGEVPCDICLGLKLKAQKTCLVCLASYCQLHLEPHQRVKTLKKHKLTDPVSNLEDRVCKRHDKMFEFFCHSDQTCVCFMCLKDDHMMHVAVPLEHVFRERKAQLENVSSEMKMIEDTVATSIKEIKYSIEQSKKKSEKEIADIDEVFAALVASLKRRQAELVEVIQEKQKAVQKQAEDRVTQLEQEVNELRRRRSRIEQVSQAEDDIHHLQNWPSLYFSALNTDQFLPESFSSPPFAPDLSDSSQQNYVEMVKKAVAKTEKTLSNEIEMLLHGVTPSDDCESAKQPDAAEKLMTDVFVKEAWNPPRDRLMMIQQCDAMDVTLDSYTANHRLVVSEDGKQLRFNQGQVLVNALFVRRFTYQPFILGEQGFSSGRFYYEVRVSGSAGWVLGVVKESIDKEIFWPPTPEKGGWTFGKLHDEDQYFFESGSLLLRQSPQTVGVFVDYEKGEVSFYDVDTRTLLYSYTECIFTESTPVLKLLLYSLAGIPSLISTRPKLYPFFGVYGDDQDSVLTITPVAPAP
ncbi:E3 ubiquitin-protein ligase TRIM39-like [Toxotes jaculatrix]|uniref:E3 ubiquitin-protein ligase TRIM39-like n=1 Tax=Toxotes jaculatrix TaxID=941984 RepID=UPI001B3AD187|nr:E3 ubiquitin-protein ligase TRIM39-like [Toxotes jaculatrix]